MDTPGLCSAEAQHGSGWWETTVTPCASARPASEQEGGFSAKSGRHVVAHGGQGAGAGGVSRGCATTGKDAFRVEREVSTPYAVSLLPPEAFRRRRAYKLLQDEPVGMYMCVWPHINSASPPPAAPPGITSPPPPPVSSAFLPPVSGATAAELPPSTGPEAEPLTSSELLATSAGASLARKMSIQTTGAGLTLLGRHRPDPPSPVFLPVPLTGFSRPLRTSSSPPAGWCCSSPWASSC
jgi:hypothetical protein